MIKPVNAFDAAAGEYDAQFTVTRLGRWLRESIWEQLQAIFHPGDRVLELGCGTGTDAIWLAHQGIHVTATDASPAMLGVARRKITAAGVTEWVQLRALDLNAPQTNYWQPAQGYDGALSNFGALNCLPDRRPLARTLAGWIKPAGHLVLVVMGPFCPWELAWYLLHGQPRTAMRRWRSGIRANVGNGATVRVWYPSPRRLRIEFSPWFHPVETAGLGVLLPPPYLRELVDRRPRLFRKLARWERRWRDRFPWTWLNDHYLIVFERV